jgi:REP element-mobilizing transposase RayT
MTIFVHDISVLQGAHGRAPLRKCDEPLFAMPQNIPSMPLSKGHRSIRYPGHDYSSPGAYFITLCAEGFKQIFGRIESGRVVHSLSGEIVREEWLRTPEIRAEIELDDFVVMPNHFHAIVWIRQITSAIDDASVRQGAHGRAPLQRGARTLGAMIAGFKSVTASRINQDRKSPGEPVWQRNYYERIIRDENELETTRSYIRLNPEKWESDEYGEKKL